VTLSEAACRAATPTRCQAHTRLYQGGRLVEEGFDVERVSDHLEDPSKVLWLDLLQPSEADMAVLVEELGLHPLAIEDALHPHQRPKLDRYHDHLFLAAYAAHVPPAADCQVALVEIAAFITPHALVTVRKSPDARLDAMLARWDAGGQIAAAGVPFLVHGLVDSLVDGYETVLRDLDDRSGAIEDALFGDDAVPGSGDVQRQTFELRTAVSHLRRVVVPMRDVVLALRRRDSELYDEQVEPYLRDVDDHLQRVLDGVDAVRELLATVLDTTLAVQGQRLNQTIFQLTAYAAILAATTAITGFFGQNVPFPGFGHTAGFVGSLALLLLSAGGLYVYFKHKRWL
jgi:magnesium transporter